MIRSCSAGNVCDRLYNLAQEKQNKDHAKARSKKVSEETASRQPRINSKSRLLVQQKKQKQRGGLKVEDRLLATGAKYRQKADTRAKAVKSHEVECCHHHSCNAGTITVAMSPSQLQCRHHHSCNACAATITVAMLVPCFRVVLGLLVEPCRILCCCSV